MVGTPPDAFASAAFAHPAQRAKSSFENLFKV
jgi:hypothetical protein